MADAPTTPAPGGHDAGRAAAAAMNEPKGTAPAETLEQKAARLVSGNPHEYEAALLNATPTEKAALEKAKAASAPAKFIFAAVPGGAFNVDGAGFGASGTLTVNGVEVQTTRWSDNSIRGTLPKGLGRGPVVVTSGGKVFNGSY